MAKQTKLKTLKGQTFGALITAAKYANELAKHTKDPGHASVAQYLVELAKSVQDVQMASEIVDANGNFIPKEEETQESS